VHAFDSAQHATVEPTNYNPVQAAQQRTLSSPLKATNRVTFITAHDSADDTTTEYANCATDSTTFDAAVGTPFIPTFCNSVVNTKCAAIQPTLRSSEFTAILSADKWSHNTAFVRSILSAIHSTHFTAFDATYCHSIVAAFQKSKLPTYDSAFSYSDNYSNKPALDETIDATNTTTERISNFSTQQV
jgi:hypothetical protein